jgi:hypothetical protein
MTIPVQVQGNTMRVAFDSFGLDAYERFLATKRLPESRVEFDAESETYCVTAPARFASLMGVDAGPAVRTPLPLAEYLWDYQRHFVQQAFAARRYAIWADCGLGKTAMFLEFARLVMAATSRRVLILSPLQIIEQTRDQAREFYGDALTVERIETRDALIAWCMADGAALGICNYEKMIAGDIAEFRHLGGLIADESSILKTGGGTIKWNLIRSARGIEYKLSCTATPAPNDAMEYASQAAFLESIRHEGEVLWTWFTRDKNGEWYIKPHAREGFYRFMAGWSVYLRDPAAYGFRENTEPPPAPIYIETPIEQTIEQAGFAHDFAVAATGDMFANERMGVSVRAKLSQAAKGFYYDAKKHSIRIRSSKPAAVAQAVRDEVAAGLQVLVWTIFDEEATILAELLADVDGVDVLTGKTQEGLRQPMIERFRHGQSRVLITRASMMGYGINFPMCGAMVFSGWNDSFEQFYQAIRRAVRTGQRGHVRIHVPVIPELEGAILANVMQKQTRFEHETAVQERNYIEAMKGMGL